MQRGERVRLKKGLLGPNTEEGGIGGRWQQQSQDCSEEVETIKMRRERGGVRAGWNLLNHTFPWASSSWSSHQWPGTPIWAWACPSGGAAVAALVLLIEPFSSVFFRGY